MASKRPREFDLQAGGSSSSTAGPFGDSERLLGAPHPKRKRSEPRLLSADAEGGLLGGPVGVGNGGLLGAANGTTSSANGKATAGTDDGFMTP